jgi:HipA-like protein
MPEMQSGPPPTLQILFQGRLVAELRKNKVLGASEYSFRYLPAFKELRLAALPGLPYREEEQTRSELWPFFAERIPDVRRPEIQAALKLNKISAIDDIALLAVLGAHSITDPYEIRLAA